MATGYSVMDALNKNSKAGVDESPRARFRTKDISIFKMYRNKLNFYDLADIEELAGDILMYGLKQNLEVVFEPNEQGEYRIVAGERRWLALKHLVGQGYKDFEIATCKLTTPQDEDEEQVEIIIANAYRTKSVKDIIEEEQRLKACLERMKADGKKIKGYDLKSGRLRDVISSMLKMSKTKIAQVESISNNLIPEFREELNNERLTFSAAYELSGMSEEQQQEALEKYKETGELSYTEIKDMKAEGQQVKEAAGQQEDVSQSDIGMNPPEELETEGENWERTASGAYVGVDMAAGEDYQTPHPEGITSLCYSCTEYETCNVKTGTCTKCDQYKNRAEAYKTDEQRYSEEQDRIDKETAKKLREQADEERMNNLPSDTKENGQKVHHIKLGASFFGEVERGEKTFELRKNDRDYKKGDILEMMEFKDGKNTGRTVRVLVTYILTEFAGLEEGYCIMATCLLNENGEPLERADIKQICADIRANGDGYIEGGDEYIMIDNAVGIIKGGGLE
nr:MAG TPA: chromosome partitioning protein [Caudoviricetes sp.]